MSVWGTWNWTVGDVVAPLVRNSTNMETMLNVWAVVEHVRVASGAAELAIFTALLYWFFTSSRVADMLEVVGERVGGWCGRDSSTTSLRQAVRNTRRRHHDMYAKLDAELATRTSALYRVKEESTVPVPQPPTRPPSGLACTRCAPISRESWQDPKTCNSSAVVNILDIGRQNFSNGGVVSRYLCDFAHCINLKKFDYKDVAPSVLQDQRFQLAIETATQEELRKSGAQSGGGDAVSTSLYQDVKRSVEAQALKIVENVNSAISHTVLRVVAWICHKAIRRLAGGGCGSRITGFERLRRANSAGLPLVFVPLHRSHLDYILVTLTLFNIGIRPPLVAAGDNMKIPLFGWFLRGCGAFYIRRRIEGSDYHDHPIYKAALRAYIVNSLAERNNLEFFIEGGRTRTGKPQHPKAGILSVIMDAYLDGTIDDALLVPMALNYDKLVDGNFVREQLGMPKQMETFWSALRGIWRTLNTNHGSIRVDFNQPISLKELVTSFKRYNHLKAPIERPLTPPNNNLAENLDRQILYNHSHSSLYGDDVTVDHKMMVEAIGRHLVYDAAQATALMSTNVVAYVLLTERRGGCTATELRAGVRRCGARLVREGRDLAYCAINTEADEQHLVTHALDMLGKGLVRREGPAGDRQRVRPQPSIAALLELSYYANTIIAHYAAPAIVVTALESLLCQPGAEQQTVRHSELMESALQLCEVVSQEFVLSAPCRRIEEQLLDAIDMLLQHELLISTQKETGLEEQRWSRRFAASLDEDDDERPDPLVKLRYTISHSEHAKFERRRLLISIRPLMESYAATCDTLRAIATDEADSHTIKLVVSRTLDSLTERFASKQMKYGEAVSTDAIRNCIRLIKQWGVVETFTQGKERRFRICSPYKNLNELDNVIQTVYRYNMDTPLLRDV